jgi:hypothetical protein
MNTKTHAALVAALATAAVFVAAAPTANAYTSCQDDNSGLGWEDPSCGMTCKTGDGLGIAVTMTVNDYVDGDFGCGGTIVYCPASYSGQCSGQTPSYKPARSNGAGTCNGHGYSGGWKNVKVNCVAGTSTEVANFIKVAITRSSVSGPGAPDFDEPATLLQMAEFGISSWAWMDVDASGVAVGAVCSLGVGCDSVIPACLTEGDIVSCSL